MALQQQVVEKKNLQKTGLIILKKQKSLAEIRQSILRIILEEKTKPPHRMMWGGKWRQRWGRGGVREPVEATHRKGEDAQHAIR